MTFGGHIRMAGAVTTIIGVLIGNLLINILGLMIMAVGVTVQVDTLEKRVSELESEGETDEKA